MIPQEIVGSDWEPEFPEGWEIATEKEILMSMSLVEFNEWLNIKGVASQEIYRLQCIERHLRDRSMTSKNEPKGSAYNPETNSIIVKPGYDYDPKSCTIFKVRS